MLLWIGFQMWKDHPLLGVGFERSNFDFKPYLAGGEAEVPRTSRPRRSRRRAHRWGVQNFWVELLADTGVVGFALGVATFVTGLVLALGRARQASFLALVAAGFILVAVGTWNADRHHRGHPARRGHLARARARRRRRWRLP